MSVRCSKILVFALAFLPTALSFAQEPEGDAAARADLVSRLEKVNVRLERFSRSKDRIFLERNISLIYRLKAEKESLEKKIGKLDAARARAAYERDLPSRRAEVESQWLSNRVVDVSGLTATNETAVVERPVPLAADGPLWEKGKGMGYTEDGVVAVTGGSRPVLWLVRREYDTEGRLIRVTPVEECVSLGR